MIKVRQTAYDDQLFIAKDRSSSVGLYVSREEAHALFEALGEKLGRTFGAQSAPPQMKAVAGEEKTR